MTVLTEYVQSAMKQAVFQELEEHSYGGRIPGWVGVIAFGRTRAECEENLTSTLEDWILLGRKLGHPLPVPSC
jgi:predicted RNase H-like HicB family nuclease